MEEKKYVIILGTGSSRVVCPWDTEVWAVNNAYRQWTDKTPGKIFIFHKQDYWVSGDPIYSWEDMNLQLTKGCNEIISLWDNSPLKATPYPYNEIMTYFKTDYFSNSLSWMIAYAIWDGYDIIRLSGCDMLEGGEYQLEKGGMEYWIGRAIGMGREVIIDQPSSLLTTINHAPYGMTDADTDVLAGRKVNVGVGLVNAKTMEVFAKEKAGSVKRKYF